MTNPRPDNNQNNLNKGKSSRFEFLDNPIANNNFNSPGQNISQTQKNIDINNPGATNNKPPANAPINNPYIDRIGFNQEFGGNQTDINSMLLDDGVYKAGEKVISRGQKINQDSSYKFVDQGSFVADPQTLVKKKDNTNIQNLRKKVGFNWQKFWQKTAVTSIVLVLFLVMIFAGAAAWAISKYNEAPNISEGNLFNINESSVVYARDGKTKIYEFFGRGKTDSKREYITIEKIPEVMQLAMIGLEDENFYYNPDGIPYSSIAKAVLECVQSLVNNCRGASGLAQQLVKNVQKDSKDDVDRKIRELFTAIKLYNEGVKTGGQKINKSDILELYLNWVDFNRTSSGIQQASRAYFGHDIDARENQGDPNSPYLLTPPKACFLAAIPQQPTYFTSSIGKPDSKAWKDFIARKNSCLSILAGKNDEKFSIRGDGKPLFIPSQEELKKWENVEVKFVDFKNDDPYPHFREYVNQEIIKFLQSIGLSEKDLNRRGLKIITTLDPEIQKKNTEVMTANRAQIIKNGGDNGASIILDGPTGEIVSMVGSLDYYDESIQGKNNILLTLQQPGSSIKPYVYSNLFEKGFNPGTVLGDVETKFLIDPNDPKSIYQPNNYGKTYNGPVTIHSALSNSLNIPAVKAGFLAAGVNNYNLRKSLDSFFDFTEATGLRYDETESGAAANYRNRCYAGSFIGGCEIIPINHATGINTLLQEGNLRTATPFVSIKDKFGEELYKPENRQKIYPSEDKKIKPEAAKEIALIMSDQNRPAFRGLEKVFTIPGWNLAAKTGTTDSNIDTWMVGGSPYYTTVVWAGRTDNQPLNQNVVAANVAAPMWIGIQKFLHEGKAVKSFSTEGLKQVGIDPISGFPRENSTTKEWMTEAQLKILESTGAKIAKPDYDPRKQTMIENRSAVISRSLKINKIDGKIAVEGKTLPENIETKTCYDFVSEYPEQANWKNPLEAWSSKNANKCGEIQNSDQDQINDKSLIPIIESSLTPGQSISPSTNINIVAKAGASSKKIVSVQITANGTPIKNYDNASGESSVSLDILTADLSTLLSGANSANIIITARDNTGSLNSKSISGIVINKAPLTPVSISVTASLSTATVSVGTNINLKLKVTGSQSNLTNVRLINQVGKSIEVATLRVDESNYIADFPYVSMQLMFDSGDTLQFEDPAKLVNLTQITPVTYLGN